MPDDNGTVTAEDGSSTDTASESIVLFQMVNCFQMYVIKMKKEKLKTRTKPKVKRISENNDNNKN